jgi:hypothetical protein
LVEKARKLRPRSVAHISRVLKGLFEIAEKLGGFFGGFFLELRGSSDKIATFLFGEIHGSICHSYNIEAGFAVLRIHCYP